MSKEIDNTELDRALVAGAVAGNKDDYRQLVEKYQNRIFALALDILRNQQDAEDVVQESFVKAYFALKDFQGNSSFYTWLYRIAHNMAIDYRRKVQRLQRYELHPCKSEDRLNEAPRDYPARSDQQPDRQAAARQDFVILQQALAQLPDEQREIIRLRELEGFSYQQISGILKLTPGTVMSRLFYARKKLQEAMKKLELSSESITESSGKVALSNDLKFNGNIVS